MSGCECEGVTLTTNKEIVIQIRASKLIDSCAPVCPCVSNSYKHKPEGAIPK